MTQANMSTAMEFLYCLRELVELKEIKETHGETEDYLKRKTLAWSTAKRLVYQNKYFGAVAATESKEPKTK